MKKLIIALLALPMFATAQIDRTKAPAPLPAPKINIGKPETFTLANGLKVYVVQNTKVPRVSATLTIDNDGIIEGDKTGLTSFAGELMRRGTAVLTKEQLDETVDFWGADLSASAFGASASSLTDYFPRVFSHMADMVLKPTLPAEELEKIRTQALSALKQAETSPGTMSSNVISKVVYGSNHPYGDVETEASLKNVNVQDIRNFFNTYWKPNNAYLIFVGDIDAATARNLADKYLGSWKSGAVPKQTYPQVKAPAKTFIAIVDRPQSVQSDITFITPLNLKPGAPDAIPSSVMNNLLGGGGNARLFKNLRETHGFTYGAYSSISPDRLAGTFRANASVRNEKTDSAIAEFIYEFNRIRNEAALAEDVSRTKNEMSGAFARGLESPSTIARFALNIARNNLPADYYENYLTNLAAVTPQDLQTMANKYVLPENMYIVVVGKAKDIAAGLEKFGEVKYYDAFGNPKSAPVTKAADASVTAESVLQKAVAAQGGAKLSTLTDVVMTGKGSLMGQEADVTTQYIIGSAYSNAITMNSPMGAMEVQKELYKDGKYKSGQMGQMSDGDEQDNEYALMNSYFVDESYMLKTKGFTYKLTGIENVNNEDAYGVEITSPKGNKMTNYYSVATGFKVKSLITADGPDGKPSQIPVVFGNYKDYNGIKAPAKVSLDFGGGLMLDITYSDVKLNTGLKAADLK